jgi:protein ImuA
VPAGRHGAVAFGDPRLDAHLPPGGLLRGALHEIMADGIEGEIGALTAAFAALLLGRLLAGMEGARPVIWIGCRTDLYPPGLAAYGLDPARLLLVRSGGDVSTLGAAELALRDGAAAAVVAETGGLPWLAGRRLTLAAEAHGSTALVLRRWPYGRQRPGAAKQAHGTTAATRWRLAGIPSLPEGRAPGPPRWQVTLLYARGGRPGEWIITPTAGEGDAPDVVPVAAELADAAGRAPRQRRA